ERVNDESRFSVSPVSDNTQAYSRCSSAQPEARLVAPRGGREEVHGCCADPSRDTVSRRHDRQHGDNTMITKFDSCGGGSRKRTTFARATRIPLMVVEAAAEGRGAPSQVLVVPHGAASFKLIRQVDVPVDGAGRLVRGPRHRDITPFLGDMTARARPRTTTPRPQTARGG